VDVIWLSLWNSFTHNGLARNFFYLVFLAGWLAGFVLAG
jgi:hypothetical protein